jgi:hypothetical protein
MDLNDDPLESLPEDPPAWPRCPTCRVPLIERRDPRTGKAVRSGGRAMMECPRCHEASILPGPRSAMRRFRIIRGLVTGSVLLGGIGGVLTKMAMNRAAGGRPENVSHLNVVVPLVLVGGAATVLHFGMESAARAVACREPERRVNEWALVVFWAALVGLMVWLGFRMGWPIVKTGAGGPLPLPAAVAQ